MYTTCNHAHGAKHFGFGNSFHGNAHFPPFGSRFKRPKYNVPMNISETENAFIVELFATGFSKEDITLQVSEDTLFIKGTKELDTSPQFIRQEFPVKNFERSLYLNGQADVENSTAVSENGILKITLPKTEDAKKTERKINIQ